MPVVGMNSAVVTLSPKFQIVLPKQLREFLGLTPGKKMVVMARGRQLILVPVESDIRKLKGFAPKMDSSDVRDHSDRF